MQISICTCSIDRVECVSERIHTYIHTYIHTNTLIQFLCGIYSIYDPYLCYPVVRGQFRLHFFRAERILPEPALDVVPVPAQRISLKHVRPVTHYHYWQRGVQLVEWTAKYDRYGM